MRTGSTLLQWVLRDAGFGNAHEYLHGNNPTADSYAGYAWHIRNGNENDHFLGWRVMWGQLWGQQKRESTWDDVQPETMLDGIVEALNVDSVRYIHLTRRDRLRQAVSFLRAESGRRWYCPADDAPHDIDIPFTSETIERVEFFLKHFPKYDERWRAYFAANGVKPLQLVYEDMTANERALRRDLARVAAHIGGNVEDVYNVPIPLRKQAGDDVERWIARYENL
jgi:LPS sulfotransferase NodH